jgi:hypothetical protein
MGYFRMMKILATYYADGAEHVGAWWRGGVMSGVMLQVKKKQMLRIGIGRGGWSEFRWRKE